MTQINILRLKAALKKFQEAITSNPEGAKELLTENGYTKDEVKQIIASATFLEEDPIMKEVKPKAAEPAKAKAKAEKVKGDLILLYHERHNGYHYCPIDVHEAAKSNANFEQGWKEIGKDLTETEAFAIRDSHKAEIEKAMAKKAKAAAKAEE